MITLYCRIDNECRCDTYDNCSIRTEKGGKRSYMIQRFAYFTQSGTILTLNRLCFVRKCPFYSLEQPLKKRILKELCSSVVSGSTSIFPAYVWSFDPFLSHAGPCPDSFTLQNTFRQKSTGKTDLARTGGIGWLLQNITATTHK